MQVEVGKPLESQGQAHIMTADPANITNSRLDLFGNLSLPLGLGPPSPDSFQSNLGPISAMIHEDSGWEQISNTTPHYLGGSRKRFRKELENFGRNIRQCLLCGLFKRQGNNEGLTEDVGHNRIGQFSDSIPSSNPCTPYPRNPIGRWEASSHQLP